MKRALAIVVLGGSRGIGHAIVERAVADGHRVFAGARGARDLAALKHAVARQPGTFGTAVVDVGDDASLGAFYAAARAALGAFDAPRGIDVVVNNAAIEGHGRLTETPPEVIEA